MKISSLEHGKIPGREKCNGYISEFSFYKITRVLTIHIDPCNLDDLHSLKIGFLYESGTEGSFLLKFRFTGIRQLVFPAFCPHAFVSEIEVEDLSQDQIEGVSFQMKDFGQSDFIVLCKNLELIECVSIQNSENP